jgi:hypothetical protein
MVLMKERYLAAVFFTDVGGKPYTINWGLLNRAPP